MTHDLHCSVLGIETVEDGIVRVGNSSTTQITTLNIVSASLEVKVIPMISLLWVGLWLGSSGMLLLLGADLGLSRLGLSQRGKCSEKTKTKL